MSVPAPSSGSSALDALTARSDIWRGAGGHSIPAESTGSPRLDAQLPGGGWPLGALTELLLDAHGIGELRLAMPLLARLTQAGRHVAFVAPPHIPYAPALVQQGLVLERVLILEPKSADETLWAAEQLLRTAAYGAVLAWTNTAKEADLRRLQLAAESGKGVALLYRPMRALGAPTVAALRLKLSQQEGRLALEILKSRGGRVGKTLFAELGADAA